jgi:ankyrin repeat protein
MLQMSLLDPPKFPHWLPGERRRSSMGGRHLLCLFCGTIASAALAVVCFSPGLHAAPRTRVKADDAVQRVLPLLQSSARTWHRKRECSSCHHQGLGIIAVTVARERGFAIDAEMLADEVRRSARPPSSRDWLLLREVSFNEQIADSYLAVAQAAVRTPAMDVAQWTVHMLAGSQHVDGHWTSRSHRPPLEDSDFTATALTIRTLQAYGPQGRAAEISSRLARARAWLAAARPRSSEDRAMTLFGLAWAGADVDQVGAARNAVLRDQRPDGGWAQFAGARSDAYATGQALVALNQAGLLSVTHAAYQRGVAFLLRTQQKDGTWRVETRRTHAPGLPFFETGFPHDEHQFISYAATAWAVMALALTRDGSPTTAWMGAKIEPLRESRGASADPATPLMEAAFDGTVADLERELRGAEVNAATELGVTALMWAAHDPEKVRRLLAAGANPNSTTRSGHTALLIAAGYDGARDCVQLLLDAGADATVVTTEGQLPAFTPLVRAAMRGDIDMVKALHAHGARIVAGHPPLAMALLMAASQGDAPMVDTLLRLGGPVDARYPKDYERAEPTLLMQAIADGQADVVKLLLGRGASLEARDSRGRSPLMYAAAAIDRGDTWIVEMLLEAQPDLSARTSEGETALTLAVEYRNRNAAGLLRRAEKLDYRRRD